MASGAHRGHGPAVGRADQGWLIDAEGLGQLIAELARQGHRVLGPVVRDGAVALGPLSGVDDLPRGWHDTQGPGHYRLVHRGDDTLFGWAVGPGSAKAEVFPSHTVLWRAQVRGAEVGLEEVDEPAVVTALVGVRPCEVAALDVLDRVLGQGRHVDPYHRRHAPAFVAVAECGTPAGSCFCTSMATGPEAGGRFDLALTELPGPGGPRLLVRVGSTAGAAVLQAVTTRPAGAGDLEARTAVLAGAEARMGRRLDTDGLPRLLADNLEHPRWDEVAERCLACGNCTLVCPTCFCATVADTTDVAGTVQRDRVWASCFDLEHSYLHGGPVRASTRSRYRQWMTHKLSTWWDQFGTSGCVGCGRCITWCPVGIDITEEVAAIRADGGAPGARPAGPAAPGAER